MTFYKSGTLRLRDDDMALELIACPSPSPSPIFDLGQRSLSYSRFPRNVMFAGDIWIFRFQIPATISSEVSDSH
jgi:hypothetical protein